MILKTSTKNNTSSQTRDKKWRGDQTNIKAPTKQENKNITRRKQVRQEKNNIKQQTRDYTDTKGHWKQDKEQNTKKNHIKQPNKGLNKNPNTQKTRQRPHHEENESPKNKTRTNQAQNKTRTWSGLVTPVSSACLHTPFARGPIFTTFFSRLDPELNIPVESEYRWGNQGAIALWGEAGKAVLRGEIRGGSGELSSESTIYGSDRLVVVWISSDF